MEARGLQPDVIAYSTIIDCFCKEMLFKDATDLCTKMMDKGIVPDTIVYNSLIAATYNAMIFGYCKAKKLSEALELFHRMCEIGLIPNIITYNTLIQDVLTYTTLTHALCKEGLADKAYKLFVRMKDKQCLADRCCYNLMVQGFLHNGYWSEAMQLIMEMIDKGFSATDTTIYLMIDAIKATPYSLPDDVDAKIGDRCDYLTDAKILVKDIVKLGSLAEDDNSTEEGRTFRL
ncbi:hypothetical protein REPUB_Repub16aG0050200 [Reevesia pubescens]